MLLSAEVGRHLAEESTHTESFFVQTLGTPFIPAAPEKKPCYSYMLMDGRVWTPANHAAASPLKERQSEAELKTAAEQELFQAFRASVFYVGKGSGGRLSQHLSPAQVKGE
jgi:hypothetical protein